jgi:tyramine---L-glutamate ligase
MKLFVYEHITSGALAEQNLPASLVNEGNQMLLATLQDCHETQHCTLITLRDNRLDELSLFQQNTQHHCHQITTIADYDQAWSHCLIQCDMVLIIAPETDAILVSLQQRALDARKTILGSQPRAIQSTTNKLHCHQHLSQVGIPSIPTQLASDCLASDLSSQNGYILKPLDGAGCVETYFFKTASELQSHLATLTQLELNQQVVQPYCNGTDLSLCLLATDNAIEVLSINQQHLIQSQGQLSLSACTINSQNKTLPSLTQANQIAQQVKAAFPGLFGFIGIDLIHNDNGLYIVDINPRLTTSYIALRTALNLNPMQRLFDIIEQKKTALSPITQRKTIKLTL